MFRSRRVLRPRVAAAALSLVAAAGVVTAATQAPASASMCQPGYFTPGTGPMQTTPTVYVDFWGWGSDPATAHDQMIRMIKGMGGSTWFNTLAQYGVNTQRSVYGGEWDDPATPPSSVSDDQLRTETLAAAAHFGLSDSVNNLILVLTPTGVSNGGGHHNWAGSTSYPTGLPYATCDYPSDSNVPLYDQCVGHELAEAITDPLVGKFGITNWYNRNGKLGEIADACSYSSVQPAMVTFSDGNQYQMQPLFSNLNQDCVLGTTLPAGGPPTPDVGTPQPKGGDGTSELVWGDTGQSSNQAFGWIEYGTTTAYGSDNDSTTDFQFYDPSGSRLWYFTLSNLSPGVTYHYRMHMATLAGEAVTADNTFTVPPVSANASATSGTGAESVYGRVNPGSAGSGTEQVYYGTTTGYGSSTSPQQVNAASGSPTAYYLQNLTGLTPGVTYHYRVGWTSGGSTTYTPDQTFTAPGAVQAGAPLAGTQTAQAGGTGSEQILGQGYLRGATSATATVYWGTDQAYDYGGQTTMNISTGSGDPRLMAATLTGLQSGVTYHYQVVITNSTGSDTSPDQTFTAP